MSEASAVATNVLSAATSVSGAVDAVANAPQTISKVFDLAEKLAYGTFYTVAFVVVFPGALLFAAVPKGNPVVRGLIDGSHAARARAESFFR